MSLIAVIEITSYEISSLGLRKYLRLPDGQRAVTLPMSTPDGLPNHLQVLIIDDKRPLAPPAEIVS